MMYLFVHDDSWTSYRFTTKTEQLTKCCEPLQKMRMTLGPCKTGLRSPVVLYCSISFEIAVYLSGFPRRFIKGH